MDTPGHADFGGEVERIMKMLTGLFGRRCLRRNHTCFVLKAWNKILSQSWLSNKIDKPSARPAEVVTKYWSSFIELGADDDQLDFPVVCFSYQWNFHFLDDPKLTRKQCTNLWYHYWPYPSSSGQLQVSCSSRCSWTAMTSQVVSVSDVSLPMW